MKLTNGLKIPCTFIHFISESQNTESNEDFTKNKDSSDTKHNQNHKENVEEKKAKQEKSFYEKVKEESSTIRSEGSRWWNREKEKVDQNIDWKQSMRKQIKERLLVGIVI